MHTEIDKQVIGRFFTAIDALIEQEEIESIQSYCTANGFDYKTICSLRNGNSTRAFHFDLIMPLIMDYGVSSLWLNTGLGEMFMPMYQSSKKAS